MKTNFCIKLKNNELNNFTLYFPCPSREVKYKRHIFIFENRRIDHLNT